MSRAHRIRTVARIAAEHRYDASYRHQRNVAARDFRRKNPDAVLLRKYGITLAEKEILLAKQKGSCALCDETVGLEVDHDHDTKKVRGLLCDRHNRGLGFFSLHELQQALIYLTR